MPVEVPVAWAVAVARLTVTWVVAGDDALLTFLTGAGWATDSAHRELDLDGTGATRVKQVRLHTRLA